MSDSNDTKNIYSKITGSLIKQVEKIRVKKIEPDEQFKNFLNCINTTEEKRQEYMQNELQKNYKIWSDHYSRLKDEFNALWDFFQYLENTCPGWFCVSPTLSPWKSVSHDTNGGYNFSACIMKNHNRSAPMSEKSLHITCGLEQYGGGLGDEIELGRTLPISDELQGLETCEANSLEHQYLASKKLVEKVEQHKLLFRLNHKTIGQDSTRLDIDILDKYELSVLAEKLFMLLNKDMIEEINLELSGITTKQISQN